MSLSDSGAGIKRYRRSSSVWEHFNEVLRDGNRNVRCKHCKETLRFHSNTSNMKKHLQTRHPFVDVRRIAGSNDGAEIPSTSGSCQGSLVPYFQQCTAASHQKQIDEAILKIIVGDLRPINLVDGVFFQELLLLIAPKYKIPNRKWFSEGICSLHAEKKELVKSILANIHSIALTTDSWSSIKLQFYLCVTAHFISDDFTYVSLMLSTKLVTEKHTAQNLCS